MFGLVSSQPPLLHTLLPQALNEPRDDTIERIVLKTLSISYSPGTTVDVAFSEHAPHLGGTNLVYIYIYPLNSVNAV